MLNCNFRVSGEDFDPTFIVKEISIIVDDYWQKGQRRFPESKTNHSTYDTGGFQCAASNIDGGELKEQIEDAISFLELYDADLKKLTSIPEIENMVLDFGHDLKIDENTWTQSDYLPPKLLRLAGNLNIGIELSLYPVDLEERAKNYTMRQN